MNSGHDPYLCRGNPTLTPPAEIISTGKIVIWEYSCTAQYVNHMACMHHRYMTNAIIYTLELTRQQLGYVAESKSILYKRITKYQTVTLNCCKHNCVYFPCLKCSWEREQHKPACHNSPTLDHPSSIHPTGIYMYGGSAWCICGFIVRSGAVPATWLGGDHSELPVGPAFTGLVR